MPFLVDGSNLGGVAGGAAGARDRSSVLRLLLPWARRRRVTVVFDGTPDAGLATSYGALQLRYAVGRPADQLILGLLGRRPADWTVVSDDRDLLAACRGRGARVLPASELFARLAPGAGKNDPGTKPAAGAASRRDDAVDVAEWEEWFRRGREGSED
jgi:hypothetical protein